MGRGAAAARRGTGTGGGTGLAGFAYVPDRGIELHTPKNGELRKLRYELLPDVWKAGKARPQLLDLIFHREVMQWVTFMEREGYTLLTRPEGPFYRICPNPQRPAGTRWAVVKARWFHHGPIGEISGDDAAQFQAERAAIGADEKLKNPAGVGRWLDSMSEEDAIAAVQAAKPVKERDDDFD